MSEELGGGWGQEVSPIRVGQTVRRQIGARSEFTHRVLRFLEQQKFGWAPRFLGIDDLGREVIEYMEGYVPHGQDVPAATWSLATMEEIFRHIRALHDITSGTDLAVNKECVCHGDLSYANTVYRDGKAVAFIDWDWARPGRRIDDVAYALLQYLSIGEYHSEDGPQERALLARQLVDAYGFEHEQRCRVVDAMLDALLRTRDKQVAEIARGTAAGIRLADAGVPERMLSRHRWLHAHRDHFERAMS